MEMPVWLLLTFLVVLAVASPRYGVDSRLPPAGGDPWAPPLVSAHGVWSGVEQVGAARLLQVGPVRTEHPLGQR
jgi:hypothetical protein